MSRGTVLVLARRARGLKGIRRALGLSGCRWMVATDQVKALDLLRHEAPDLVLMELAAVRAMGVDLVRVLRRAADSAGFPVLLVADSDLVRPEDAAILEEVDGFLAGGEASPATLQQAMRREDAGLDARLRLLSELGEITRTLGTTPDRRTLQEQILTLLHRELRLPSVLLAANPGHDGIMPICYRGVDAEGAAVLRVDPGDPVLEALRDRAERVVVVEPSAAGGGLAAWCARHGYLGAAAAGMHCRGGFKGALLVLSRRPDRPGQGDLGLLAALAAQAALILDNLELYQGAWAKQVLVEKLLGRVIFAQEEERKWMAAEIHDTVAQSLVGMLTKVQTCRQLLNSQPEQAAELLEELRFLVTESLREIRQILFNLRPASLDDLGLGPSLENYVRRFQQESGIQMAMVLPGREQSRLPPLLETTVFRLAQEALTNIKKHSGARRARLSLDIGTTDLRLTVSDDGRGLVWSEVSERFQSGESHGLQGMQERARLVGGSFRISNDPSGGTLVEVVIPLARGAPAAGLGAPPLEGELTELLQEVLGASLQGSELATDSGRH